MKKPPHPGRSPEMMYSAYVAATERRRRISDHIGQRLLLIAPELNEDDFPAWNLIDLHKEVGSTLDESLKYAAAWITPCWSRLPDATHSIVIFRFGLCTHLLGRLLPYSTLLRNAIHEAAHLAGWYELIRKTSNKFSKVELQSRGEDHGRDFRRRDSCFVHRARELGVWRPRIAPPDELKDLFGIKMERITAESRA